MKETRFYYFGRPNGDGHRGVLTVAARLNPSLRIVDLACAFCSPEDNFSKKVGRSIALCRLGSKRRGAGIRRSYHVELQDNMFNTVVKAFNEGRIPQEDRPHLWKHRILTSDTGQDMRPSFVEAR